jgi:hypothetical protein
MQLFKSRAEFDKIVTHWSHSCPRNFTVTAFFSKKFEIHAKHKCVKVMEKCGARTNVFNFYRQGLTWSFVQLIFSLKWMHRGETAA